MHVGFARTHKAWRAYPTFARGSCYHCLVSQLEKILGYLMQDQVTEVQLIVGQPISVIAGGRPRPLTSAPLAKVQLIALLEGTDIARRLTSGATTWMADLFGRSHTFIAVNEAGNVGVKVQLTSKTARGSMPAVPASNVSSTSAMASSQPAGPSADLRATGAASSSASSTPLGASPARATPVAAAPSAPPDELPPGLRETDADANFELDMKPGAPKSSHRAALRADVAPAQAMGVATTAMLQGGKQGMGSLFGDAVQRRASDVHVAAGIPIMMRIAGELVPEGTALPAEKAEAMLRSLLTPAQVELVTTRGYVDAAFDVSGGVRVRANVSRQRQGWKGSFRLIPPTIPTLETLSLPTELAKVTKYHQGLVVIAGPNGHGKTTTLAALVDQINTHKPHHIITVEDPVEYVHPIKKSVMSQRQVGAHTQSFASALKAALREDPDVIVIGELRDRETVEIALTAAETGHLVLATMSTPSAGKTLDRLVDMFPPEEQAQVRVSLAGAIKFVVAQRLLKGTDGTSFHAAIELVTGVLPLAMLIRDNKLYQLPSLQQRGKAFGMIRLDDSLLELVRSGRIKEETALAVADSKKELSAALHPQAVAQKPNDPPAGAAAAAGAKAAELKNRLGNMFGKKE